ncbi:MAG TPA: hypothetical protein VMW65_08880, partial [Chloroflexota bacterium]|nr:hypothetical protein [Chloroflexota bacterium]
MLHEFAVEPRLLCNWKDFRYFVENFGADRGRLIARYPKAWKRMVYDSLVSCGAVEKKRIEERLRQIDDRLLVGRTDWDAAVDWLTNAEAEHVARPFHAVLAVANPRQRSFVLEGESLDDKEPRWALPTSRLVPKTADDLAAAVAPLLRCATRVVFIDPYFGPESGSHRRTFEALVQVLGAATRHRKLERIEFHSGDQAAATFFQAECRGRRAKLIPVWISVRFVRWRKEQLHNRYILTDCGGILFGHGLDEQQGSGVDHDDLALLSRDAWRQHWADYVVPSPRLTFVDEITVVGTKPKPNTPR